MKAWRWIRAGAAPALAALVVWITIAYRDTLNAAQSRISAGSSIAQTACGPVEYASRGEGPPLLVVHGAGGGFDQGLMLGELLPGFQVIAMSRFGYLRTPLPPDASAEAQADAHACLLDALGLYRTYANARYTADHIPRAKFVGFPRGGHMGVGHEAELAAAVREFLAGMKTAAAE